MTYTVIVMKNGEELVFKEVCDFVIYPGRAKLVLPSDQHPDFGTWHTIEEVDGVILHKEGDEDG